MPQRHLRHKLRQQHTFQTAAKDLEHFDSPQTANDQLCRIFPYSQDQAEQNNNPLLQACPVPSNYKITSE